MAKSNSNPPNGGNASKPNTGESKGSQIPTNRNPPPPPPPRPPAPENPPPSK